jgi:GTP-binding protein
MPQTRFVLRKAFQFGLTPVVVINKIDRDGARPADVLNEVYDLFIELGADDSMLEFPAVYASALHGHASLDPHEPGRDMQPLFDVIIERLPPPQADPEAALQMLITTLDYNDYVGRIGIGRVFAGRMKAGQDVVVIRRDGTRVREQIGELFMFEGLGRQKVDCVSAGEICAVVGLESVDIGNTLADPDHPQPLPIIAVDEPTLHMTMRVNDSPSAGRSGKFLTSRHLRERLERECQHNVALRVEPGHTPEEFHVSGRGLLHLSVLIENMRREGYELSVGKPKVIFRELDGHKTEPIELCVVDVPAEHIGAIMELLGSRRGVCNRMDNQGELTQLEFTVPARGLIGLRNRLMNATNGTAILHHNFYEYELFRGAIPGRVNGVMIASEAGAVTSYALDGLNDRGTMFVTPEDRVYVGQVVGEHCKDDDIQVNVCRAKKLTNMRAAGSDKNIILKPARVMSLEIALEFIAEDELVEVTPDSIRLRKRLLDENERRRSERSKVRK